jgi:glycosyltransferase involved in cell wall biosynthesis
VRNVERIVILYPGETSSERINQPANYSLSRMLLRLHDESRIPIHFFNTSPRYEAYGNIEFIPFSNWSYVRNLIRFARNGRTLIINQMNTYHRYARAMRSMFRDSRLLVRLGGVYYGRQHLDSRMFEAEVRSSLRYLRRADMVLSTADGTPVDYFMEKVGVPPERYRKWLNGFPELPNTGGYARENRVVCVSRLSREKGIDYVIRSFAAAAPRLRERHVLSMVGDGPSRPALERLAFDLGVADAVEFEGESFDVARYLYSSKLLLSGLANNPIMEAIATGTPVIAVELGETAALYGSHANVHVVDYPPGGCGPIAGTFLEPLVDATAERMVQILNGVTPVLDPTEDGELYSWDQRLQDEIDLYDNLFEWGT